MRTMSAQLAAHLAGPSTTRCNLLKIVPLTGAAIFGITSLDADVIYDDGSGDGPITYRAATGYTPFDTDTKSDLSVDSSEAVGLVSQFPFDGVTLDGIAAGDYDSARFLQYLVNYADLTMGHCIISGGQIGQITTNDNLGTQIELRSLTQILKQNTIIEVTSITCRAAYGDVRCKMPLRWYQSSVGTVGAESDRTFNCATSPGSGDAPAPGATQIVTDVQILSGDGVQSVAQLADSAAEPVTSGFTVANIKSDGAVLNEGSEYTVSASGLVTFLGTSGNPEAPAEGVSITWSGTAPLAPDGFFVPGVVHWLTGANVGRENEIESYAQATATVTLAIPTRMPIVAGDTFKIRRDCAKSKAACIAYGNLLNMRGEPELPRANGVDVQSPTPSV